MTRTKNLNKDVIPDLFEAVEAILTLTFFATHNNEDSARKALVKLAKFVAGLLKDSFLVHCGNLCVVPP